jgi:hypothetical protein
VSYLLTVSREGADSVSTQRVTFWTPPTHIKALTAAEDLAGAVSNANLRSDDSVSVPTAGGVSLV